MTPEEIRELERRKREKVKNNSEIIYKSNTTRKKIAQHADNTMPGTGVAV